MPIVFAAAELAVDAVTITCCYFADPVAADPAATPLSEFAVGFLVSAGAVAVSVAAKAEEDGPAGLLGADASY